MNWKLLFVELFISFTAFSQIAIVDSKDGYSNIRSSASSGSKILAVLQNNSVVIIDATDSEPIESTTWRKVYFGADKHCKDCTADFKEGYNSGYIHQSQIKDLEELKEVNSDSILMHYVIVPFDPATKEITYLDGSISSINGFSFYGADCGLPKTEIINAKAVIKGQTIKIPMVYLWNILHAQNNFRYFQHDDNLFALQRVGDGACSTDVVWKFTDSILTQRLLGFSY